MSHLQNNDWLDAALEHYDEAVAAHDWHMAKCVIADIREAGFDHQAHMLQLDLDSKDPYKNSTPTL